MFHVIRALIRYGAEKHTQRPKPGSAWRKRLAELLIEISSGDAAAKRRLRLALAGAQRPNAREVRKRLTAISRSRSFVDWQNRRALIDDLETQRRAIVEHFGKADFKEALDLMWNFLALASSVFARCDDSSGTAIVVFHAGVSDLGRWPKPPKAMRLNWPIVWISTDQGL